MRYCAIYIIVFYSGYDIINVEIKLIFLFKLFFLYEQRGFIEENTVFFLEGESPTLSCSVDLHCSTYEKNNYAT